VRPLSGMTLCDMQVMEYNTVKGEGLYYGVLYGDDDEEDLDEESLLKLLKIYNRRLGEACISSRVITLLG